MLLVRHLGGSIFFLVRDGEEAASIAHLRQTYPGHDVEVVQRRTGLLIVKVSKADGAGKPAPSGPELAIVDLAFPVARSSREREASGT